MPEGWTPELIAGFRELLGEFRGVGEALGEVVERTARLETKVDRLVTDQAAVARIEGRLTEVEHWFRAEMAARNALGVARALWIAAGATLIGGGLGAVIAHFWK